MTPRPADAPIERLHALDAARAFALLLGIGLHATMSFFLPVPATDSSPSTTLAVGFYVVHLFRMALFFLLAGFFARLSLQRRGLREFVKERARRILVPLSVGWLVLVPITLGVTAWGWSRTAGGAAPPVAPNATGLPLIHLWFLYYLALLTVLALSLRALAQRVDETGALSLRIDAGLRRGIAWRLAPLAMAAPIGALLYFDAGWLPWFGVPTPDTGLLPQAPALLAFGASFAIGWLLHRQAALLQELASQWRGHLALAVALTLACLAIVGPTPPAIGALAFDGDASLRIAYVAAYTLAAGYWSLGLLGAALRFCARASAVRRYLADASYWLYLAHLPVVFALQVLVARWPLHWALKFPLIVGVALALLLASYHWLVRPTAIGELLNGRRIVRQPRGAVADVPARAEDDDCVARLRGVSKRFGDTRALDGLDLEVRAGELLAVLGPNGAGKSTAIGLWLGTLEADEGAVTVLGGSPRDVHSRLGLGVMLQDVVLAPELRAREHVALVASYYRAPWPVDEAIALAGIGALADARYGKLSGGQKRQVQFALAVCGRPRLLFLDEPTVGLDIEAREALWRAIRVLRDGGCAIVLTTHYLEEAEALADRVVVVAQGRAIAQGSVAQMRALVARKRIRCASALSSEVVGRWPGVLEATRDAQTLSITAIDADDVVRRLFVADPALTGLEVEAAGLADAFAQLTREAA